MATQPSLQSSDSTSPKQERDPQAAVEPKQLRPVRSSAAAVANESNKPVSSFLCPTVSLSLHSFSSSSLLASLMKTDARCNLQESGKATAKHPIPYSHLFISDAVAQDSKPAAASAEAEKVGRPKHMAVC